MNFILETDKFARQLEAWKKGHGFSDRGALQNMAEIWDTFKNIPERKKVIYGSVTSSPPKTDLSCGSCVQDMLQMVYNWRKICENEVTIYFTGVPQAEVIEQKVYEESKSELEKAFDDHLNNSLSLKKMHEVRSIAKKKKIQYTNKTTRQELIELLNAKV